MVIICTYDKNEFEYIYNFYSNISDQPVFPHGLTEKQITEYTKDEYGNSGLRELPGRLVRARQMGSSNHLSDSLESTIDIYLSEQNIKLDNFIKEFLTLPKKKDK